MTNSPGQPARQRSSHARLKILLCLLLLLILSGSAIAHAAAMGQAGLGNAARSVDGFKGSDRAGSRKHDRRERAERRADRRQERTGLRAERREKQAERRRERVERRAEHRREPIERRTERRWDRTEFRQERRQRKERRTDRSVKQPTNPGGAPQSANPPQPENPPQSENPMLAADLAQDEGAPQPASQPQAQDLPQETTPKSEPAAQRRDGQLTSGKSEFHLTKRSPAKPRARSIISTTGLSEPALGESKGRLSGAKFAALGQQARGEAERRKTTKPKKPVRTIATEVVLSLPLANAARIETEIAQSYRLTIVERNDMALIGRRIVRCRIADRRSLSAVLAAMRNDGRIVSAQPNYLHQSQGVTINQYALEKLGINAAHAMATGAGVIIAVIDTGIDATHPALASAIIGTFDATGENTPLTDPHGTAIAGIIAGRSGVEGVAPQAKLLDVRVFASAPEGNGPAATTMSLLKGLQWAADHGARIVNLSLTGGRDELVGQAVEAMLAQDIIIVAAAGNNGADAPEAYPAAFSGVIAVTATDAGDALYDAANRGAYITVAAPGVDVIAPAFNASYAIHTGTSFAAAYVSGVVALMLEREPRLSAIQIRTALQAKAKDLGPPGTDDQFGAGRVSALAVLQ